MKQHNKSLINVYFAPIVSKIQPTGDHLKCFQTHRVHLEKSSSHLFSSFLVLHIDFLYFLTSSDTTVAKNKLNNILYIHTSPFPCLPLKYNLVNFFKKLEQSKGCIGGGGVVLCGGMFGDGVFFIRGGGTEDALWRL